MIRGTKDRPPTVPEKGYHTGSSSRASLTITISAVESLGLQGKIRNCNVYLRGISNHTLKLLGQVTATVRVSSHLSLEQNFIVIPDEYLTSDILMGADLIGRAEFYWVGEKRDLYWGNQHYRVSLAMSSTINSDLQSISEWGTRNLVKFNTSKTQLLTISLSNTPSNYPIIFEDSEIPSLNSFNILGLQISSSLSWRDHIVQIAKSASKKLGVLFRCKQYFNSAQLFKLYTGFIRPCLEYCSHIWGSSPYTSLLDRIESKAIRLIGDPSLTSTLDPLSVRRKVASLSLFYHYYFGHCSDELATCIPPPMARPRSTRQATFAHNYCVELSNARINRFSDGFFPSTSHLWNFLPSSVFPASFNLPSFKRQVYHHLRGQMA